MVVFLWVVAVLQIAAGVLVFVSAKSAVHEILGILPIGFGVLTIGLASILEELKNIQRTDG